MAETPASGEWQRSVEVLRRRLGGDVPASRRVRLLRIVVLAAVLAIALLVAGADWIQKELWMRQLGYADVFWTIMSLRWELFGAAFVATFLYLWANLRVAIKNGEILHSAGLANEFSAGGEELAGCHLRTSRHS
ncbi:MAG: UPF0182 family protein [Syntrophobacteraceae bacterium]